MEEGRSAFKILTGKPTGKRPLGRPFKILPTGKKPLGRPRRRWEENGH